MPGERAVHCAIPRSPTTFVVASCDKPDEPLGVYHTSALTPFLNGTGPVSCSASQEKGRRPRKQPLVPRVLRRECHKDYPTLLGGMQHSLRNAAVVAEVFESVIRLQLQRLLRCDCDTATTTVGTWYQIKAQSIVLGITS
ncbi:hypothetical protein TNCV_503391 [Trichonephila clavipes]|nr:hypothetical protein TNCV_503391 [Trichonephila clavipes]